MNTEPRWSGGLECKINFRISIIVCVMRTGAYEAKPSRRSEEEFLAAAFIGSPIVVSAHRPLYQRMHRSCGRALFTLEHHPPQRGDAGRHVVHSESERSTAF